MNQNNQINSHFRGNFSDNKDRIDLDNFVPDPSKRNDLKNRLYDKGISNVPMPSVKRPIEENIATKPYSAKMNPNIIQSLSKVKQSVDNITKKIYSNLQDSYKEAAALEAKYKGEGTADYYKAQHVALPEPNQSGINKGPASMLRPKLSQTRDGPAVTGLASTNQILLNKCAKPGQLPALSDYGMSRIGQFGQTEPTMRLMQGPPSMVLAGFEGGYSINQKNLELARSKFLVDKLTNKLPPELRGGKAMKLPPLDDDVVSRHSQMSDKLKKGLGAQDADEDQKKPEIIQQKWNDLDKYIELLLDNKSEEETVFVYLNPNTNGNPYDLQVCTYSERTEKKYYTLSGKGLTLYENDTPIEFLSLGQWLIERDSFNHIKELNFFKKFKKWKFMRMWKKTIKKQNRMRAQNALEEKLFILQEHFSSHLMTHRKYMMDMESKRFVDTCQGKDTQRMSIFAQQQMEQTSKVTEEIKIYSNKCRENIRNCIQAVLKDLRDRITEEIYMDENRKKQNPIQSSNTITMKRKETNNAYDKLGFPEGMTYGHRSSLRKECSRFLRFAYLVDFLSLQSLANIYLCSVQDMIERVSELDINCDMEKVLNKDYSDQNQAASGIKTNEPLFYVEILLASETKIPANAIEQRQIEDFILPPRGTSKPEDFDPLAHLELEEPKAEGEEDEEPDPDEAVVIKPIFQKIVPKIETFWLRMDPSKDEYISVILEAFAGGLKKISVVFERWSRHNELQQYFEVLEEWDDIVGDNWDPADTPKLDPITWISENSLHTQQTAIISDILNSAFDKMKIFLKRFQPILEIYWRNQQFNKTILVDEQLKNPIESLQNVLKLFYHHDVMFSSQIPTIADIGLIQLDAKTARGQIQPTPKKAITEIELYIPQEIKIRNDEAKKWLQERIRELSSPVNTVEEFVQQDEFFNGCYTNFQNVRDRVDMFGQIYHIMAESGLKVPKEEKTSISESIQDITKLSNILQQVESSQEQNKEKFKKTLNELIPKLDNDINELFSLAEDTKFIQKENTEKMYDILKELDKIEFDFNELEQRSQLYNKWQQVLDTQPTVFENLDNAREAMTLRCLMWRSLKEWQEMNEVWLKTRFNDIDAKSIQKQADIYYKTCMRLEKNMPPNMIQVQLKEQVEQFKDAMPIVTALRNDKLEEIHMNQIKELIQHEDLDTSAEDFTLKRLIDMQINHFQEDIVAISTTATQENMLNSQLFELNENWKKQQFCIEVDEKTEQQVLKKLDDLYTFLDESLAAINMILSSRFVARLRDRAQTFKDQITILNELLEQWQKCQQSWLYLGNIFKAPDIKKDLPNETKSFESVHKNFSTLITSTFKSPSCRTLVTSKGHHVVEQLKDNNIKLEEVQKGLNAYMEKKRMAFPRFYFLSDDELIDILANSTDYNSIQQHLKTCFDNVVSVDINEEKITHMNSNEKEKVEMKKEFKVVPQPEIWLMNLQKEMINTLSDLMKKAYADYLSQDRKNFVLTHKGQIVATMAQIYWCSNTENALNDGENPFAVSEWYDMNVTQLEQLTELVRGDLTDLQRRIIVALVTTDVHARDIVEELKNDNVKSAFDFKWAKQLRYYYNEENALDGKNVQIKQVSATLNYGYEFMGATSRLVITPLTDRCWITISNALHIKLGANPAGPAGTGKTESTKDLAKAIAIQCIVYNCSDQVNYQLMGKLFSGLCQQGCWTCLDEFNRIDIEVLSVIAQQLLQIQRGLIEEKEKFLFEDQSIALKPEFGCHVTMNPGYAGRTELPDNLKVLFRPVAMMIPDYGLIAEIMLFAEGFTNARILSKKMVQLYKLSSEQLSQQDHYDFGLRAVKSVLVMAGSLKRANPNLVEDGVLIRAMRDANVPKFLKHDLPLFNAIIQDLFPTIEISENDYGNLEKVIKEIIVRNNLQLHKPFITKVIQLFETFNVRFGVMVVGPTGSGKTASYEILAETMTYLRECGDPNPVFQLIKKFVLNPKAISMGELYGEVNSTTLDWTDGLASKVMRNAAQELGEDRTWVVFDGPVDALWIENMNTVLDDNMTLCLANGQRIKLRSQMRMLFEVQDLAVASPATVSRCGMVYLTPEELGWRPYIKTWITTFFTDEEIMTPELKAHLLMLFEATIDIGIEFVRTHGVEPIKTTDLQLVNSLSNFLENFISFERGFKGSDDDKKKILECLFAWSYAWGLGGALEQRYKEKFDQTIRDLFKGVGFPNSYTVFDYFYDLKKEKTFKPWIQKMQPFTYDKEASYFDLMVPTTDTTKYAFIMETLLAIERPLFFTGNSGVGKSVVIANLLSQLKEKGGLLPININMSAQTTSLKTQFGIQEKLEKKKRGLFGAPPGKKIAIFIDDINMPQVEEYGAQPPIELLRLFLDKKGMYIRGEWVWQDIIDTTIIACAAPPSGGRAVITPRFTRKMNVLCLPEASSGTLSTIFGSILKGFLSNGFGEKVRNLEEACINSTVEIYNRIQDELRPTPSKFHYLFNLRDVSKVVQGLCMSKPVSYPSEDVFMRLWVNETFRVFYDRLINEEDREWYKKLILELLSRNFKMAPDPEELFSKLKFGDLLKLDAPVQLYEYIVDKNKLIKSLHGALDDYNMSNSNKMNLVLFDDALDHVLKIARCLRQPRGHIMLIGVGGSGKQSLLRLSTFMRQMEFKQIEIVKNYGIVQFLDFMKELIKSAGVGGQGISFVLTDTQIINESFIENLNNLLNTGEIPNLMLPEDRDFIIEGVRPICNEKKIVDTVDNIQALFIARVRENLHICLCMSPVGETLRVRCRQFPSLVNCCTLDWFSRWPEQALLFVSREFLKELPDCSETVKQGLSEMCMRIHISVEEMSEEFFQSLRRRVYTTPKSYLDLISLYLKVLEQKRHEYQQNRSRLATGLSKLNETNSEIAKLKVELARMAPILTATNEELAVALVKVGQDKAIADEKEKVVSGEAEIVGKKAAEAQAIKDDAEADLAAAKPDLIKAQQAVKDLDRNSLVEMKATASPNEKVVFIMDCVMVMLKCDTGWPSIKKQLGDVNGFMKSLQEFDVEKVSDKVWKKARDTYISKPNFDPEAAKAVSLPAFALCKWAIACSKYAEVTKRVAPKKAKLAEVQQVLQSAQAELNIKQSQVAEVKAKVAFLQQECDTMQAKKEKLEFDMDRSNNQMRRANLLVDLLADEGLRWKQSVENIGGEIERLVGNVFISCACISYFGGFTGPYREKLVAQWVEGCLEKKIPTSEDFSLIKVMGDPVVIRNWGIASLPSDQVSIENGILTTKAERYALCIDPQQQANKWIKNMEKDNKLSLLKFGTDIFLRSMITNVSVGNPVLVQDVEENIDPAIDPILLKQAYKTEAGIWQVRLGDSNVNYDHNFNFFMTTKMPNPHYIPEICIKVTLINFTVTFEGLQQQLLGDVVVAEKPQTEKDKDRIVLQMAADSKTLKEIENKILSLLASATTIEILDADTLIDILKASKITTNEINGRMADAKVLEVTINDTRNMYSSVAVRGSILYFVIADLGGIDPMYQNSLVYVKMLFNKAIAQSPQATTVDERIEILIDRISRILYTNISRGLFEKDKIIYSFLIATSIRRKALVLEETCWNIFLRGPTVFSQEETAAKAHNPDLSVVNPIAWDILCSLEVRVQGKQFNGLSRNIVNNWNSWVSWAKDNENPYKVPLPDPDLDAALNNFEKLIMVKIFRPEMVQQSMADYIIRELGQFYVEPPSASMEILYRDIDPTIPLIYVLSAGADPTSLLLKFAKERDFSDKLFTISLGQGQGKKAAELINKGITEGHWVMLQNCHLFKSWMTDLEKIVLNLAEIRSTLHEDFRLFLTSMPATYFPVAVLQNSVKLTTEPPRGLRANLKRSYQNLSQEILNQTDKPEIWRKLIFNFSFFHAVLQERRKFGPLGWNIRYEFNDSDLDTSRTMLKLFMEQDEVPWDALNFVTGHINYGGRVTDDNDRRCLIDILFKYCSNESLKETYKFSESGIYYAPLDGKIEDYRNYIDSLPLNDSPEIFGLHENSNIKYENQESSRVIETILSVQPRLTSGGGGLTPDQIVLEKAKEIAFLIPELLEKKDGLKELFQANDQGIIPSLSTVLQQEMDKFNKLLSVMSKSLKDIQLAINGFIVMSESLDSMYVSIQNNQVPALWAKVSYPSLKPLAIWVPDLLERVAFVRNWLMNGNPNSYWLPGLFFPQGFMTGVLQTHARQYKIAIDQLAFSFEIQEAEYADQIEEKPEDGVFIHGLFMDGARFDRENQVITEQYFAKMSETMPIILFKPVVDYKPDPEEYQAPLYKTSLRAGVLSTTGQSTNFVVHVSIPSKEPPTHWVMRAAALLCMND